MSGLLPGGPLAERFGGEWIFGLGILLMSVASVLIPAIVHSDLGAGGLIFLRILCGLGAVSISCMPFTGTTLIPFSNLIICILIEKQFVFLYSRV